MHKKHLIKDHRQQYFFKFFDPIKTSVIADLVYLSLLLGVMYLLFLGFRPLNNPDEGRYAEIAREMVTTGNYLTPMLNGIKFLDKPVLFYWLTAACIKIFGINEWAVRLVPAFFTVFSCIFVYLATRIIYDARIGWIAAVLLAGSPVYFGAGHYVNVDMLVNVFITCSLLIFWVVFTSNQYSAKTKYLLIMLAYFFAALATLTKGLIGIVFPIMITIGWMFVTNQLYLIKKLLSIGGILIYLVIALPWYYLVQKNNPEFFNYFFVYQHYQRFLHSGFNNVMPLWFYIPVFLIGFFPWSLFIPMSFVYLKKHTLYKDSKILFLLIWFFFVFVFFSVPQSKIISYILPLFPPMAIVIGYILGQYWYEKPNDKILMISKMCIVVSCILVSGLFIAKYLFGNNKMFLNFPITIIYIVAVVLLCGTIVAYRSLLKYGVKKFFNTLVLTTFCLLLLLLRVIPLFVKDSVKDLALIIKPYIAHSEIINYYRFYHDLPFYTGKIVTIVDNWKPEESMEDNYKKYFVLASRHQDTSDWLIDVDNLVKRWASKDRKFIFVGSNELNNFKHIMKVHELAFSEIASNNLAHVFVNCNCQLNDLTKN